MKDLRELREEAEKATSNRRHCIAWHMPRHSELKSIQIGECADCGMEVIVNTRPLPNDIDISGEAVALNCGDNRK